ncbi:unnamed protein product [Protopolystoma xenopodis]|uniref:Uncharacterized protein n=1 Tax=Protopolystoma xenopodis TaxID=117903 RepID=A0A3S5CJM5_9PLAT|nr:unnamed protein product [Protopolystoma xenopodis]
MTGLRERLALETSIQDSQIEVDGASLRRRLGDYARLPRASSQFTLLSPPVGKPLLLSTKATLTKWHFIW